MVKSKREGHATGTAFVHFTTKEGADALLEQVSSSTGFVFNGRLLYGHRAVARDEAREKFAPKPKSFDEKGKDRRNLYLLNESRVRTERQSEAKGMSKEDAELRQRLATAAKLKLKTPIMFVSPTRLTVCLALFWLDSLGRKLTLKPLLALQIHNIPFTYRDDQLRSVCLQMASSAKSTSPPLIHECRIMRRRKGNDEKGHAVLGKSMGFGFVEFGTHEDALRCLRKLNNHPETFTNERVS